jgi:hypothetical protein
MDRPFESGDMVAIFNLDTDRPNKWCLKHHLSVRDSLGNDDLVDSVKFSGDLLIGLKLLTWKDKFSSSSIDVHGSFWRIASTLGNIQDVMGIQFGYWVHINLFF